MIILLEMCIVLYSKQNVDGSQDGSCLRFYLWPPPHYINLSQTKAIIMLREYYWATEY